MRKIELDPKLQQMIALLEESGYDPKAQIHAYLVTGDVAYITRHGGAREKIKQCEKRKLSYYIETYQNKK